MSKELPIPEDMMERLKDMSKPPIIHMIVLENALVASSELGNKEHYKFIQSLIDAENTLKDSESYKSMLKLSEQIWNNCQPISVENYLEMIAKAGKMLWDNKNKPLMDSIMVARESAVKNILPNVRIKDVLEKVLTILNEGLQKSKQRVEYHKKKLQELEEKRQELEEKGQELEINKQQVEEYKVKLAYHRDEIIRYSALVHKTEPMYVSQFMKDTYRQEMKLLEIPTSKKAGKTYLSKEDKKLLKDLEPYYNRDEDGHSDLWFGGIYHEDFFKKLSKRYHKSVDGIKKFTQRHDPKKK